MVLLIRPISSSPSRGIPMLLETEASTALVAVVAKETVPQLWSELLPILQDKGEKFLQVYSEDELFRLLCMETLDLWIGARNGHIDGFAVCGWETHARARYYHIVGIFGDNLSLYLKDGLRAMEHYALGMGAVEVVVEGRRGWQRLLAKQGYAPRTVRLRKNVRKALGN